MSMTDSAQGTCRNYGCENEPTRNITFPAMAGGLSPFEGSYCDEHADEILGDHMVFSGAREVSRAF